MTTHEKRISGSTLMAHLSAVLDEITESQTVFFVALDESTVLGGSEFVLGPESVCGAVLGLVDPEYGWPEPVEVENVDNVWMLAPGFRRHPFVCRDGKCVAVGITKSEYEAIKKKSC